MTTKILEIGHEPNTGSAVDPELEFAEIKDKQIYTCDIDAKNGVDIVHDIREPFHDAHQAYYDIILCSHVLEHIEYGKVQVAIRNVVECLKVGGYVEFVVPNIEWACKRLLDGRFTSSVLAVIYGCQGDPYDYHRSAFTPDALCQLCADCGLELLKCDIIRFDIRHTEIIGGKEISNRVPSEQIVYIGKRVL